MLRIADKLENRATQLSGGEMQRVAIGRALVRRPAIYLMDEPLSSLDAKLRADLRLELKRIQQELGATILYVTHDQIEAMTMANRIGVLEKGRLVQIGTPREIYSDPANIYVATRLGQPAINLLPAGLIPHRRHPAGARTVGARTEHLRIAKAQNGDGDRQGRLDRASRRPEPPACQRRRPEAGHARRSRESGSRAATPSRLTCCRSALLRRRRQSGRGRGRGLTCRSKPADDP